MADKYKLMTDNGYRFTGRNDSDDSEEYFPRGNSGSLDTVFSVLSDRRRRSLLFYLSEMAGTVTERSQLVETVRNTTEADETPSKDTVALELHHNHLPRLDDAGFIDYDSRQGTVRYFPSHEVEDWLDHYADGQKPEPLP